MGDDVLDLQGNIEKLFTWIGEPGQCRGCQAPIWWIVHKNGKRVPYTAQALNHFIDCPEANTFRKPKGQDRRS